MLKKEFYCKSKTPNSRENPVSAPIFKKVFTVNDIPQDFKVEICGLGIYELYLNGIRVTKGYLAPYRANPNHFLYYDEYELANKLKKGDNVLVVTLGNGFNNSLSKVWDFDKFPWASAPKFSLSASFDGNEIFTAKDFMCADSEVTFDDFHSGEHIDANLKQDYSSLSYDGFTNVILADAPKGELTLCTAEPILPYAYAKPIRITKSPKGYVYDFGIAAAGTYNLKIAGEKGQKITTTSADALYETGEVVERITACVANRIEGYIQCDWLTLSGNGIDEFEPRYTYKGCRFIEIRGITEEQAYSLDITFLRMSSSFKATGEFWCDNPIVNQIQAITINANLANFFYFPTDCPQREKNGWTGDALLSAEQFMYNMDCANSLTVWLENIVKAQRADGALPGIVPTNDWGFVDWSGPSWDGVIFELPYQIYKFTGDTKGIEICADAMVKYLKFMQVYRDDKGLYDYGLWDYLPMSKNTPVVHTTTAMCKYLADTASKCLKVIGRTQDALYAENLANEIKQAYKKHLLFENCNSFIDSQTEQAMIIDFDIVEKEDLPRSVKRLKEYIKFLANGDIDVGILGHRHIYRALADNGEHELAFKLITQDAPHSYKTMLDMGSTTLIEEYPQFSSRIDALKRDDERLNSFNHHFRGDVSAFFYKYIAGINVISANEVNFAPLDFKDITTVNATHVFPSGEMKVKLQKLDILYSANVTVPKGIKVTVTAPNGYKLVTEKTLKDGENLVQFVKI